MSTINTPSKKRSRVDQCSDFWDDDFDGDAIDDCFKKATQDKQSQRDITLITTYSIFKEAKQMCTSTQFPDASDSSQISVENKIKELEKKLTEKEGEASILRANFLNIKACYDAEQEKKKLEWAKRLAVIEKENKTFKSELQLKKLEIANLKQQVAELYKFTSVEQSSTQKISVNVKPEDSNATSSGNTKIYINEIKLSGKERDFTNSFLNCFKATTFWLQNLQNQTKTHKTVDFNNGGDFNVHLGFVTKMNCSDVKLEECCSYMPKIVSTFFQLIKGFQDSLKEIEEEAFLPNMEKSDQECNLDFLRNSSVTKISLILSSMLELFGEILPYNSNLRLNFLTEWSEQLKEFVPNEMVAPSVFLHQLCDIISRIRRLGKEKQCSTFLAASVTLLCTFLGCEDFTNIYTPKQQIVEDILTDLLLLNHQGVNELMVNTSRFFNIITRTSIFNIQLCSYNRQNAPRKDFCRFEIYITSIEAALLNVENHISFSNISKNVLDLSYNIFKSEKLMTDEQEDRSCSCISKLSKLTTEIIYRYFVIYKTDNCKTEGLYKNCAAILRLLVFNAFGQTQKDVTDVVQFKEIMYHLNDMQNRHLKHLEKICLSDDFSTLTTEKFAHVNL